MWVENNKSAVASLQRSCFFASFCAQAKFPIRLSCVLSIDHLSFLLKACESRGCVSRK